MILQYISNTGIQYFVGVLHHTLQCHICSAVQYFSIPNGKYPNFGPINVQKGQLKTVQKLSQIADAKKISAFISTKSPTIQRSHNLLRLINTDYEARITIILKCMFQTKTKQIDSRVSIYFKNRTFRNCYIVNDAFCH